MTLKNYIQNNWFQLLIAVYALHGALMIVVFFPLRLLTTTILLFVVPGYFVARILRRDIFTLEGAFIVLASSVALNILWELTLNKIFSIMLTELNVFLMNAALVAILTAGYLLTRSNEDELPQKN